MKKLKYIKSYTKFVNESNKNQMSSLEDILDMEFLTKYLVDGSEYSEDTDKKNGYQTLMLMMDAKYIKFDISNKDNAAWLDLQNNFSDFCKTNDLYNPTVTSLSDDSQIVFSADTDMVDVRESKSVNTKVDKQIETVLQHYMIAALWSSNDGDTPLDSNYTIDDIVTETKDKMKADVTKFVNDNLREITLSGLSDEQIGHDFWLTRNHHGAGFFDRKLDKEIEDKLEKSAHDFKDFELYVGDDKKIHN